MSSVVWPVMAAVQVLTGKRPHRHCCLPACPARNKVDISKLTPAEQQAFRMYGKLPSRSVNKVQVGLIRISWQGE